LANLKENFMSRFRNFVVFSLLCALTLTGLGFELPSATAQTRRAQTSDARVRNLVRTVRNNADNFRLSLEGALQTIRLRGTESDNINRSVENLNRAIEDFEVRFNDRTANAEDVRLILNEADDINDFLQRTRLGAPVNRDWNTLKNSLASLANEYRIAWNNTTRDNFPPRSTDSNNYPSAGSSRFGGRLTGTYRLDATRSDDARQVADRAVAGLPSVDRETARGTLEQRLETPELLAIETTGRQVTIASSRAPRYTFEADGRDRYETAPGGAQLRVRTVLAGDRLEVSTTGDRGNDYFVSFEPVDGGRGLRVERRISTDLVRRPVVVQSFYEKTSDVAQLDVYDRPTTGNNYPSGSTTGGTTGRRGEYIIPNNTTLRAILNESLSTKTSQENDRFTMTVETPDQYRGAVIEGYVSGLKSTGKVTGRTQMTFNFETIRLRDGRSYDFAGFVENMRTANGEEVKVDNEGAVKGENQGKTTATRGAVGAAVGALIGAIAGGGKGAAIGAIIGAGAGAGSVYIEGRENLELGSGTEVYVRSSAPATTRRN
jgi:hypothetical protein